jgi:hypothetical protein
VPLDKPAFSLKGASLSHHGENGLAPWHEGDLVCSLAPKSEPVDIPTQAKPGLSRSRVWMSH